MECHIKKAECYSALPETSSLLRWSVAWLGCRAFRLELRTIVRFCVRMRRKNLHTVGFDVSFVKLATFDGQVDRDNSRIVCHGGMKLSACGSCSHCSRGGFSEPGRPHAGRCQVVIFEPVVSFENLCKTEGQIADQKGDTILRDRTDVSCHAQCLSRIGHSPR